MQRRHLLLSASVAGASAVLATAGCGFKLRGVQNFAFASIYINMPENSTLGTELKRTLASNNNLRVIVDPAQMMKSDVILDSLFEQRQKVVVATNAAGLVRELQLRLLFSFRLRTPPRQRADFAGRVAAAAGHQLQRNGGTGQRCRRRSALPRHAKRHCAASHAASGRCVIAVKQPCNWPVCNSPNTFSAG
jgi:hypothetical protein